MIPLRIFGMCANICFLAYGFLAKVYPSMVLALVLPPFRASRLYQMLELTKKAKAASLGDLTMDWLKPFMNKRSVAAGDVLFRKRVRLRHHVIHGYWAIQVDRDRRGGAPGEVIGEIGLMAPDNKRTLTFECVEAGELLTISYSQVK